MFFIVLVRPRLHLSCLALTSEPRSAVLQVLGQQLSQVPLVLQSLLVQQVVQELQALLVLQELLLVVLVLHFLQVQQHRQTGSQELLP